MRFLQQLLPPHTHTQHVPTADVVVRSLTEADPFAYLVVNDLHVTHPHTHTHTHWSSTPGYDNDFKVMIRSCQ